MNELTKVQPIYLINSELSKLYNFNSIPIDESQEILLAVTNAHSESLTIQFRSQILIDGQKIPTKYDRDIICPGITGIITPTLTEQNFNLPKGKLITVAIGLQTGFTNYPMPGAVYISVFLRDVTSGEVRYQLINDFVYWKNNLSFPNVNNINGEHWRPLTILIPDPAAGANFVFTCPIQFMFKVKDVSFRLVTDANIANRTGAIGIYLNDDGATTINKFFISNVVHAASLTKNYFFQETPIRDNTIINYVLEPFTETILKQGDAIASGINNLQATDQISLISIHGLAMTLCQ